ncbi:MAG: enoyl-CoA hydratase-related protein, partial [bacterium]|nr:enoyl-CoA hydratase-related protein [bacterium]
GGTQRLARLVGMARAMEINMTGDMIPAEEACRIGLVNKVVPADKLMEEVYALAAKICQKSAPVIRLILRAAYGGIEGSLEDGLKLESDLFGLVFTTEDKSEGIAAFLEKREAKFQHR